MKKADVFVVCFDLANKQSLQNVNNLWKKEIETHNGHDKPRLLAGLKNDILPNNNVIYKDDIEYSRSKGRFYSYCESSAKARTGMETVFENCVAVFMAM